MGTIEFCGNERFGSLADLPINSREFLTQLP